MPDVEASLVAICAFPGASYTGESIALSASVAARPLLLVSLGVTYEEDSIDNYPRV